MVLYLSVFWVWHICNLGCQYYSLNKPTRTFSCSLDIFSQTVQPQLRVSVGLIQFRCFFFWDSLRAYWPWTQYMITHLLARLAELNGCCLVQSFCSHSCAASCALLALQNCLQFLWSSLSCVAAQRFLPLHQNESSKIGNTWKLLITLSWDLLIYVSGCITSRRKYWICAQHP